MALDYPGYPKEETSRFIFDRFDYYQSNMFHALDNHGFSCMMCDVEIYHLYWIALCYTGYDRLAFE